jgi:hypothetical protein
MRHTRSVLCLVLAAGTLAAAQSAPTVPAETLLDRDILAAFDAELSGVAAKDHVSRLTQFHRVPASNGFHDAIDYVMTRAKAFGLSDVHVETFPGDGTTWFGTLHGNRGWRVDGGWLDEVGPQPRRRVAPVRRLATPEGPPPTDHMRTPLRLGRASTAGCQWPRR